MILVDTSVWVDHFRNGNDGLRALLESAEAMIHPFVLGELACGSLKDRSTILNLLKALPQAPVAEDEEVLSLLEQRRLWGKGLGWIDAHLIASAFLAGAHLMTLDKRLRSATSDLGINA